MRYRALIALSREESGQARERALERTLSNLRSEPRVEAADYNYIRTASWVPNDPKFGDLTVDPSKDPGQWGLKTAHFPGAWNDVKDRKANIAILDSGIDTGHPDVVGNIAAQKNFFNGGTVVKHRYGHGTHVAGIAAALTNNGRGVAGVCPACKLLVAKVMDSSEGVEDANLMPAIDWSVKHGADVINLSFGGSGGDAGNEVLGATIRKAHPRGPHGRGLRPRERDQQGCSLRVGPSWVARLRRQEGR